LLDLVVEQEGRCLYSGIPLSFAAKTPFMASLECLEPKRGHMQGNVGFICVELNTREFNQFCRDRVDEIWQFSKYSACNNNNGTTTTVSTGLPSITDET